MARCRLIQKSFTPCSFQSASNAHLGQSSMNRTSIGVVVCIGLGVSQLQRCAYAVCSVLSPVWCIQILQLVPYVSVETTEPSTALLQQSKATKGSHPWKNFASQFNIGTNPPLYVFLVAFLVFFLFPLAFIFVQWTFFSFFFFSLL